MPQPRHVLLVDDDEAMRLVLTRLVQRTCLDVTFAEAINGVEALAALATQTPDLLITDYEMQILDGLELIRTLRAQGATMPILALSSEARIADAMLSAGAQAFLVKPFRLAECTQVVSSLLPSCDETRAVGE